MRPYKVINECSECGNVSNSAKVTGTFNFNKVKANLEACLQCKGCCTNQGNSNECCDTKTPLGKIKGSLQFVDKCGHIKKYKFSSTTPALVSIIPGSHGIVEAKFNMAFLEDLGTGETTYDNKVVLTATIISDDSWMGMVNITRPGESDLIVYGFYHGRVDIESSC
jgi:hypothetical protein